MWLFCREKSCSCIRLVSKSGLVINRVHPTKLMAISVPRGDYFLLDRCVRELELELGCDAQCS